MLGTATYGVTTIVNVKSTHMVRGTKIIGSNQGSIHSKRVDYDSSQSDHHILLVEKLGTGDPYYIVDGLSNVFGYTNVGTNVFHRPLINSRRTSRNI